MKRITIYDVAKEADVSLATVSRVINDSNVVREDTRQRVQEAIEKLGCFKESESLVMLSDHSERVNLVYKKKKATPPQYPRMYSKIKKSPL